MRKTALPLIFIVAVGAALFYVSQEEHGAGTLALLAAVLLVGQICATLPFIFEAKNSRAGTQGKAAEDAQKIVANQRVIHEDLRSLGETLIRRLNAISERQDAVEKKLLAEIAKNAPDLDGDFEELFGKITRALDERANDLAERIEDNDFSEIEEAISESEEKILSSLDGVSETLDAVDEKLSGIEFRAVEEEEDEDAAAESAPADDEEEEEPREEEVADEEAVPAESAEPDDGVEDFPEDADEDPVPADSEAEDAPAVEQCELELGDAPAERGATLVLDAMLGIGNKPFLRGNAPGLSEDAGTPMTFVEIGRWSHDFAPLSKAVSVRILRNDDEGAPLGDAVTLAPGQTLELAWKPER
ncbi:MAG: hypothetical protein ACI4P3_01095 [Candidatus Spyradosoma sp.]